MRLSHRLYMWYAALVFAMSFAYALGLLYLSWCDKYNKHVVILFPNHTLDSPGSLHHFYINPQKTIEDLTDLAEARFQLFPLVLTNANGNPLAHADTTLLQLELPDGHVLTSMFDT